MNEVIGKNSEGGLSLFIELPSHKYYVRYQSGYLPNQSGVCELFLVSTFTGSCGLSIIECESVIKLYIYIMKLTGTRYIMLNHT